MKQSKASLILLGCLLLCSCKNTTETNGLDTVPAYVSDMTEFSEIEPDEAGIAAEALNVPDIPPDAEYTPDKIDELMNISSGGEMAYFVPFDGSIYYLYQCDVWTTMSKRWDIYRQDIASGEVSRCIVMENERSSSFFSAAASDKAIYYSALDDEGEWSVIEFSPADNGVSVLLSGEISDNDRVPVLTCRDNVLSWYEVNNSGKINLNLYDLSSRELTTAAEDVISSNPYERATGNAYAKDEDGTAVVYYPGGIVNTGCASESFSLIAADNDKLIWSETLSSGNTRLYLYDDGNGSETAYVISTKNHMGAGIINDCFFVNNGYSDDSTPSELMFFNMDSKSVCRNTVNGFSWAYCFPESDTVGLCSDNRIYLYHVE